MAKERSAWGIDIGQRALKALKLQSVGGELQAVAFEIIEHPNILTEPDVDKQELIRSALEQFLSRNSVAGSAVCVSVPGQSSFTRFVKLPPVETKKIPDIVRFEAEQQIPFAINDVIWRWQTFHDPDSPDVEVGIFAMKREDIANVLEHFTAVGIDVDMVQMAPLGLYNFMMFDGQAAEDGATLLVDIGVDKADLIVSDGPRIWTRTIQIGGNNFTEALVKAFKLSFPKAEKLKRTAASSKYARQIFQAMRPIFSDLVQEIQRSVGYYTSLHRETRFKRLLGLGNGFRLPGLQKFLEQNLNIPVVRIDNYSKLRPAAGVNTPVFTDNVLSFAVAYGLGVQGLGQATVATDLLPSQIARTRQWVRKRPWFAAVAAVILLVLGMKVYRSYADKSVLSGGEELREVKSISRELASLRKDYSALVNKGKQEQQQVGDILEVYKYRDYWPSLLDLICRGIRMHARDQGLLDEYAAAKTTEERKAVLDRVSAIRRSARRMFFIESMSSQYNENVLAETDPASPAGGRSQTQEASRGFEITITGRTPLAKQATNTFLAAIFRSWNDLAEGYPMISVADYGIKNYVESSAARGRSGRTDMLKGLKAGPGPTARQDPAPGDEIPAALEPDPMFPDEPFEDMAKDTRFVITLSVTIDEPEQEETGSSGRR
jgi:type IV pilus assembly protein PilM